MGEWKGGKKDRRSKDIAQAFNLFFQPLSTYRLSDEGRRGSAKDIFEVALRSSKGSDRSGEIGFFASSSSTDSTGDSKIEFSKSLYGTTMLSNHCHPCPCKYTFNLTPENWRDFFAVILQLSALLLFRR